MSTSTLPHQETIAEVLKSLETETTALLDHLSLEFLLEFPVFAPDPQGRKRVFEPPELFRGLLHCFYNDICAPKAMERELADDDVWPVCGFDRPLSWRMVDRFIDNLSGMVEEVFSGLFVRFSSAWNWVRVSESTAPTPGFLARTNILL